MKKYYIIILYGKDGLISERTVTDSNDEKTMKLFAECNNCFKTEAEAREMLNKIKEVMR